MFDMLGLATLHLNERHPEWMRDRMMAGPPVPGRRPLRALRAVMSALRAAWQRLPPADAPHPRRDAWRGRSLKD